MKISLQLLKRGAYNGLTRLRQWWKQADSNFKKIEDAHNALDTALDAEIERSTQRDEELDSALADEIGARKSLSKAIALDIAKLKDEVAAETQTRQEADRQLLNAIMAEEGRAEAAEVKIAADLEAETEERENAIRNTFSLITGEAMKRQLADEELDKKIDDKTAELADECDELRERAEKIEQSVDSEAYARSEADAAHAETLAEHEEKIARLEDKAHTHDNAEIIDAIDGERVAKWDSINNQVTQEEFDGACFSFAAELLLIWRAMGINAVDGGLFGQEQADDTLDGGDFDGEPENEFDCGDLAPLMCCCGGGIPAVIDGGDYSNITGTVIDGGDYSNTTGAVIDGGNYN